MKSNFVLATLIAVFSLSIRFTHSTLTSPQTLKCENSDKLRWLWNLRNNNRCVNIVVGTVPIPKCYFDQIFNSKFVIRMNDLDAIRTRNILSFQRTNCDNFMIFARNATKVLKLFEGTSKTVKRFLPFSQLYLVLVSDVDFDPLSLSYIYENGLFVYVVANTFEAGLSDLLSFSSLRNVLTNKMFHFERSHPSDVVPYFGTYKDHPVLNAKYKPKVFRVSLFNCSPYVVYLPDGGFDGLEYRVLKEIIRNWTLQYRKFDTSATIRDPYGEVRGQVENHESDLAMCSVWLNEKSNTYLDVTSYINYECATFLAPKPSELNPATYLYKSINGIVGCSVLMTLFAMSIIFTICGRIGRAIKGKLWNDLIHIGYSRSLFDTFGLFTGQSLLKFPKENAMKTLFFGWAIVSLLFGVIFSTGYTSLLTRPPFSKPIDTISDFLENDLVFDRKGKSNLAKAFFDTGVDMYIKMSKRNIGENGTEVSKQAVESNKLAYFTKVLSNDYVTEITPATDPDYKLRLMKTCFFNYYTVVALQKHSSYTQYFRTRIGSLQEAGIISHWKSTIEGANNLYMRPYFKRKEKHTPKPKKISLQNLSGAFWLLLGGHFIAAIVLIAEIFFNYCSKYVVRLD